MIALLLKLEQFDSDTMQPRISTSFWQLHTMIICSSTKLSHHSFFVSLLFYFFPLEPCQQKPQFIGLEQWYGCGSRWRWPRIFLHWIYFYRFNHTNTRKYTFQYLYLSSDGSLKQDHLPAGSFLKTRQHFFPAVDISWFADVSVARNSCMLSQNMFFSLTKCVSGKSNLTSTTLLYEQKVKIAM